MSTAKEIKIPSSTIIEEAKISQQEVVHPHVAPSESAPIRVLSTEDSIVSDLVKEQPDEREVLSMRPRTKKIPDLLELPEECLPFVQAKKYRYAWLTKDKNLSVKLRTNGWVLCQRINSPYIKSSRFGGHGAVEQAGMLLAYLPEAIAVEMDMVPVRQSQGRVKHYTEDIFKNQDPNAPIQYYKPEDDGKD